MTVIVESANKVSSLLDDETNRLLAKKGSVDAAYFAHQRMKTYKKSETFRMKAYRNMFIIACVVGIICMGMAFYNMQRMFLLILVVLVVGLVWILSIYVDMSRRDVFDHEKLDAKYMIPQSSLTQSSNMYGENYLDCIGQDCCHSSEFFVDGKCTTQYETVHVLNVPVDHTWNSLIDIENLSANAKWIWDRPNGYGESAVLPGKIIIFFNTYDNKSGAEIKGKLWIAADDKASVMINGKLVTNHSEQKASQYDYTFQTGLNTIQITVQNTGNAHSSAGLIASFFTDQTDQQGGTISVSVLDTDSSWKYVRTDQFAPTPMWTTLDGGFSYGDDPQRYTRGGPLQANLDNTVSCANICNDQDECDGTYECRTRIANGDCYCEANIPNDELATLMSSGIAQAFTTMNSVAVASYYKKPTFTPV